MLVTYRSQVFFLAVVAPLVDLDAVEAETMSQGACISRAPVIVALVLLLEHFSLLSCQATVVTQAGLPLQLALTVAAVVLVRCRGATPQYHVLISLAQSLCRRSSEPQVTCLHGLCVHSALVLSWYQGVALMHSGRRPHHQHLSRLVLLWTELGEKRSLRRDSQQRLSWVGCNQAWQLVRMIL